VSKKLKNFFFLRIIKMGKIINNKKAVTSFSPFGLITSGIVFIITSIIIYRQLIPVVKILYAGIGFGVISIIIGIFLFSRRGRLFR
jgi:hypothetical protein